MFRKLAIVIPTRNRSDLARLTVESVLRQARGQQVHIVLSDNSTDPEHSAALAAYMSTVAGEPVSLIRPSSPLAMAEHWEWAVSVAIEASAPSHLLILTDRMAFKNDALALVLQAVRRHPDDVISYTYDRIDDYATPVSFMALPRTGDTFRIAATEILALSAQMRFYSFFPRMLNCVAPVSLLGELKNTHGSMFISVSPDYCFCFRALDVVDSIVYVDYSALVNYGQSRSNGGSFGRGVSTPDSIDFINSSGAAKINSMTPLPEVNTIGNAVISEFLVAGHQSRHKKFPELSRDAYLRFLGLEQLKFVDPGKRKEGLRRLQDAGLDCDMNFRLSAFRQSVEGLIVRLRSKRFNTFDDAYRFAVGHPSKNKPWLRRILGRYKFGELEATAGSNDA